MNLVEFADFWPRYFETRPFTRRVAKRLIDQGELPGKVINDTPWIDCTRFELGKLNQPEQASPLEIPAGLHADILDMV